jgi:hypothetical protein
VAHKPKRKRNIVRLYQEIKQTELEVGLGNERRVVEAFTSHYPYPGRISWLYNARLSTRYEDKRGVDVVFTTDVGDILIQVKSSEFSQRVFLRRQRTGEVSKHIKVVVIKASFSPENICKAVLPVLSAERKSRLTKATV